MQGHVHLKITPQERSGLLQLLRRPALRFDARQRMRQRTHLLVRHLGFRHLPQGFMRLPWERDTDHRWLGGRRRSRVEENVVPPLPPGEKRPPTSAAGPVSAGLTEASGGRPFTSETKTRTFAG